MALSLGQKAGWGLADMGIVVFVVVKQLLILNYLTAYLGVPVGIAGFVTTGVLIFDMITDPLVGYYSDRTQSRFGRRAPWMFFGALVMCAGMVGLFAVPAGFGMAGNLAWVIAFFVLATVGFTMVAIPFSAQAGEITTDQRERSTMTGWRMGFASLGILLGGAAIPALEAKMGYAMATLAVCPLIIGAIWLSIFATRNAPRSEPSPHSFAGMFVPVLANTPFMVLTVLYGVMTLAIALITAGLQFAAIYLIIDQGNTALSPIVDKLPIVSIMLAAFVIGAILSQAIWVLLSHRIGKVGALIIGLGLYAFLLYVLNNNLPSFNVTATAGLFLLAGMTNGAYQQIPWAIYPDLMDVTRTKTGLAIEGAFTALWLFGQKLANALAPALLGLILAAAGWQESKDGAVAQSDQALAQLQWSITLLPAMILLLSLVALAVIYLPLQRRVLANTAH